MPGTAEPREGLPFVAGPAGWSEGLEADAGRPWPAAAVANLTLDVFDRPLPHAVVGLSGIDEDRLVLASAGAWRPVPAEDAIPASDGFAPGLWRGDVAEWFFGNVRTGRYSEWNLSPSGAWWCGVFAGPRKPDTAFELGPLANRLDLRAAVGGGVAGPEASSAWEDARIADCGAQTWRVVLRVRLRLVEEWLGGPLDDGASIRANFAIVQRADGGRRFGSWSRSAALPPDFHRPEDFVPLVPIRWPSGRR